MATLSIANSTTPQYAPFYASTHFTNKASQTSFSAPLLRQSKWQLKQLIQRQDKLLAPCSSYEVGGGFPIDEFGGEESSSSNGGKQEEQKLDPSQYEALLRGGEQVTSVLEEMVKLAMESRPVVADRKLLARLVLIREEARSMMGGGILDERNGRGFITLPESKVNFLTKLVAVRPGKPVREMIKNVMQGKDEGADDFTSDREPNRGQIPTGIAGKGSVTGIKPLPVRPGMFLETISKVLGNIYAGNVSGVTAQQLKWVHQNTLQILQEIAF